MTLALLLVRVSIVLMAAAGANRLLRRRSSAATRHMIWTLAVVGVLALPLCSSVLPAWTALEFSAAPEAAAVGAESSATPVEQSPIDRAMRVSDVLAVTPAPADTGPRTIPWAAVLMMAYLAGVALLLVRLGRQRATIRPIARRAALVRPRLCRAPARSRAHARRPRAVGHRDDGELACPRRTPAGRAGCGA